MSTDEIIEILSEKAIISDPAPFDKAYIFFELITKEPFEIIDMLSDSQYYIENILIWDRTKNGGSSPIGSGGRCDPSDAGFYFAETYYSRDFDENTASSEYKAYISSVKSKYPQLELYASFDIKCRHFCKGENE